MPVFFFHYHTAHETTPDDVGCQFESLELAYLDAYRSMIEIGAELLKSQVDPSSHRIDIADRAGQVLMELRFDDVFRRRQRQEPTVLRQAQVFRERYRDLRRLQDEHSRLRADMEEICKSARLAVAQAHEILERAKSKA